MKNFIVLTLLLFFLTSFLILGEKKNIEEKRLLEIDRSFAKTSTKKGIDKAYLELLKEDVIILPMDGYPIEGIKNFKEVCLALQIEIKMVKIDWTPEKVFISESGDLGYTIGKYRSKQKVSGKPIEGFYASVWKKNKNNQWKLALSQGLFQFKIKNKKPSFTIKKILSFAERALINSELAFSKYSSTHGIPNAFFNYIAENGIAVSQTGPARTKEIYKNLSLVKNNKNVKLEWRPTYSFLSSSLDLGYNTGPYIYSVIDKNEIEKKYIGFFFTIWIMENGKWRFIYDGGNSISNE